jgi:hypothetical protein
MFDILARVAICEPVKARPCLAGSSMAIDVEAQGHFTIRLAYVVVHR